MNRTVLGTVLLAGLVVVATGVSAMALSTNPGVAPADGPPDGATANGSQDPGNASTVNVTVGQQLSTVLDVSSGDVQTGFENTAFEVSVENATDEERAEAIVNRATELRDRAESIHADYREATGAYDDGEITKSEYARRLATLNARASNVLDGYERLQHRAANVSALELRVAGLDRTALNTSVANLSSVTGAGAAALLDRFTGESRGDIRIETGNGLVIEVERGEGRQSRQIERPQDGDDDFSVSQSSALDTARAALSDPDAGNWGLVESTVMEDAGSFAFVFTLRNATDVRGNAVLLVDGSSGEIVTLEEVIETPRGIEDDREDDDRDGREGDDQEDWADDWADWDDREDWGADWAEEGDDWAGDGHDGSGFWYWGGWGYWDHWDEWKTGEDRELAMVITGGVPAPNETIEVRVLDGGDLAENVSVFLNGRAVGATDADGTVEVTLPASGDAKLTAESGDAEGKLRIELGPEEGGGSEVFRKLDVDAILDGDLVTATVRYAGVGVANASVRANGRVVGWTDADGVVTFTMDANATDELDLEVHKGAFDAELQYVLRDGELVMSEEVHEADDSSGWWNDEDDDSGDGGDGGWEDGEEGDSGWGDGEHGWGDDGGGDSEDGS